MHIRKLQKTGNNTLIVSLPREWVVKNNLSPGRNVFIIELDKNSIMIKTEINENEKFCEVELQRVMEWTVREIISKYIQGYDTILVKGISSWKIGKRVKDRILRILPGVDVIENGNNLKIKVVIDTSRLNLEEIIKRNISTLIWMINSLADALANRDYALLREVESRDDEVDKMTILGSRQINEKVLNGISTIKNMPKLLYHKSVLEKIESMGDSIQVVASNATILLESGIKIKPASITRCCESLVSLLEKIPSGVVRKDMETGNYLIDESRRYVRDVLSKVRIEKIFVGRETPEVVEASALMVENLGRVAQVCREIGELIIDSSGSS